MFQRHPANPLIRPEAVPPSRPDFEVIGAFNAGVTVHQGETLLLVRVAERPLAGSPGVVRCPHLGAEGRLVIAEMRRDDPDYDFSDPRQVVHRPTNRLWLTSISHLRLARSADGVRFRVDAQPWLMPGVDAEAFGVEDARITRIDDTYYVNYTAASAQGIATALVSTQDFSACERRGVIFPPANRDVTFLPQKINGLYACYHRPMPGYFGGYNIWYATSPDLIHWGNHQLVMQSGQSGWAAGRVGGGAPPIHTPEGWLSIYHAADDRHRYCLGAFLTPHDQPQRIIRHSPQPILTPEAPYEREGFFPDVVFSCGTTLQGDRLRLYYGAADAYVALAEGSLAALLAALQPV